MEDFVRLYGFLEKELVEEILKTGVNKEYAVNSPLIREGQFISSFPLITKGLIRVSKTSAEGNELLLYYLREGEVCAMSLTCCMAHLESNIMAIAEEETGAVMLPVAMMDKWMCQYPSWKQFVMQSYQLRFRELVETIDAIAFLKLDQRLEKFFTDRYQKSGATTFSGTHQDLALQLNTSREVVSRLLKKLEKEQKITLSRNFIEFSGLL